MNDTLLHIAHELRTPLTVARGYAEVLRDNASQLRPEQIASIGTAMTQSCMKMERWIHSLLLMAQSERGTEEEFVSIDLAALARHCRDEICALHPEVEIEILELLQDGPAMVQGEPNLIEIALMNLLHNAVQHSPPPACLKLKLEPAPGQIKLTVEDRGKGISENELLRLFEPFYQVRLASSRKRENVGLGLSIVKQIMQKHRGGVEVRSQLGEGSSFALLLPTG